MTIKFVVDTDRYSGNFERELCAFMTGALGGTRAGYREANEYLQLFETPMNVIYVKGDFGMTPVDLEPTPGFLNNGLGFFYKEGEEELALEKFKETCRKDINIEIKRLERLIGEGIKGSRLESVRMETLEKLKKDLLEVEKVEDFEPYPACMSIAIKFKELDESTIAFLKERAEMYSKIEGFNITGYRILEGEEQNA